MQAPPPLAGVVPPGYTGAMPDPALARHIAACNNIASPAGLIPFRMGGAQVGWVSPDLAQALTFRPRDFHFDGDGVGLAARLRSAGARSEALAAALPSLAAGGFLRIRNEAFDLRATSTGPVLGTLDRGALPAFGAMSQGVHVNGLVRRADGLHVWVGIRAKDKAVAPGQLDNVVAGGIPAGLSPEECLVKEAAEEARLPPELAATARPAGRVSYVMSNAEGLRRDVLHCYDLDIPEGITPTPGDDEVERFELWPATRLLDAVRTTDTIKFNVNLVLIDLFLRKGLVADPDGSLRAGLDQGPD
jgi:8-oxo-dGTP pyrophosphatase MutT (NUDIX family)